MTTRITEWRDEETGLDVPVDAPDSIAVAGRFASGAEAAIQGRACPRTRPVRASRSSAARARSSSPRPSSNIGPNRLLGARGGEVLDELQPPDAYMLAPEGTPSGPPRNVAHGYARMADALGAGEAYTPGFDLAVTRHRLLAAIERSSETGVAVTLPA